MFGLFDLFHPFAAIKEFFHVAETALLLGLIGAAVGVGLSIISKFLSGLSALIVPAVIGAMCFSGLYISGYMKESSNCAEQAALLRAQQAQAQAEHDARAYKEALDKSQELLQQEAAADVERQKSLDAIKALIKKRGAAACKTAAFEEELKAISEMK